MALVNHHTCQQPVVKHRRYIFPIGQGGFAFETIDGVSVIYDCGSLTSPMRVCKYIDDIANMGIKQIDYLFISHFDKDHVNSLEYLIRKLTVCNAIIPYIQHNRRIVYNAMTYGAYLRILALFQGTESKVVEIEEGSFKTFDMPLNPLWEWAARSMFEANDWNVFDAAAQNGGINVANLESPSYVTQNRTMILKVFKNAFGVASVNAKGLIMLSQKTVNANVHSIRLQQGGQSVSLSAPNTGALYVGDADMRNKKLLTVESFLQLQNASMPLLLLQIPHHGSKYNSDFVLPQDIPSSYYFVCNKDNQRIVNNTIYSSIQYNLLMINDLDVDVVAGSIELN